MASLFKKTLSILKDRNLRNAYIRYRMSLLMGIEPTVTSFDGSRCSSPNTFNEYWAITRQHPSSNESRLFKQLVPENSVVFDVGANYGLYTVMASRSVQNVRVIAFEPLHRYCSVWHRNVERNGVLNATLFQCAVDEHGGKTSFTMDSKSPLNNRIAIGTSTASTKITTQVSTVTLDDIAESLDIDQIDLLKIDVEGGEPRVLRGARRLLESRKIRAMYVEFIIEFMEAMGEVPEKVFDYVTELGYSFHGINPEGSIGATLNKEDAVNARRVLPNAIERDFWGLNVVILRRD